MALRLMNDVLSDWVLLRGSPVVHGGAHCWVARCPWTLRERQTQKRTLDSRSGRSHRAATRFPAWGREKCCRFFLPKQKSGSGEESVTRYNACVEM